MLKIIRTIERIDIDGTEYEMYDMPVWIHREESLGNPTPHYEIILASSNIPEKILKGIGENGMKEVLSAIIELSRPSNPNTEDDAKKK